MGPDHENHHGCFIDSYRFYDIGSDPFVGPTDPFVIDGGQDPSKPVNPKPDCNALRQAVEHAYKAVSKRARELEEDPLDMVPNGHISRDNPYIDLGGKDRGSVETHQDSFQQAQRNLQKRINNSCYAARGCGCNLTSSEYAAFNAEL
jgi:hypothetical protein